MKPDIDGPLGRFVRNGAAYDLIIERRIAKPVEKVWAALTVPERLADWFTATQVDLRLGGRFNLAFDSENYRMQGVIVELEPPRLLAYTWPDPAHPDSIVRYELEPDGAGCRLILTQTGLGKDLVGSVVAGWHTFLEGLPGATEGAANPWTKAREDEVLALYQGRLPD